MPAGEHALAAYHRLTLNTNEPLKPDYLHYFYLYSNMQSMKKDERKDN